MKITLVLFALALASAWSRPSSWWRFATVAEAPIKAAASVERLFAVHAAAGSDRSAWRIVLRPHRRYQARRLWRPAARLRVFDSGIAAELLASMPSTA